MQNCIVRKLENEYPVLNSVIDGTFFLKEVYNTYYNALGGHVKNSQASKELLGSLSEENDMRWEDIVTYLYIMLENYIPGFYQKYYESLDWEGICKSDEKINKFLKTYKPNWKNYKRLYKLVLLNEGKKEEDFLMEYILESYGWDNVVKDSICLFEEYLRTDSEEVSQELNLVECTPTDIEDSEENNIETIAVSVNDEVVSEQKPMIVDETEPKTPETPAITSPMTTGKKKRGKPCRPVVFIFNDGTEKVYLTEDAAATDMGTNRSTMHRIICGQQGTLNRKEIEFKVMYKDDYEQLKLSA